MDSDGDGVLSCDEYWAYVTKVGYKVDLFNFFNKNEDGKLDFDEYITFDFICYTRGYRQCGGCSVVLLEIHFICVQCYDAGKIYYLCCKCYGDKSYHHVDGHTYFKDIQSMIECRTPKHSATEEFKEVFRGFQTGCKIISIAHAAAAAHPAAIAQNTDTFS